MVGAWTDCEGETSDKISCYAIAASDRNRLGAAMTGTMVPGVNSDRGQLFKSKSDDRKENYVCMFAEQ